MAWTTPRTWVAGETVTAALMNAHVRDNLAEIGGAWTSYTPTMTNWTLGNGTLVGRRALIGKFVQFNITLTVGSTTTTVGNVGFNLPATPRNSADGTPVGMTHLFDTSAGARRNWSFNVAGVTLGQPRDDTYTGTTGGSPWAWATGDQILVNGSFEVA